MVGRLKLQCTEQTWGSHLEMNCQHVCKYIFPEAIFNSQCCPDTHQHCALVFNSSPLFKMNMQTRLISGNTKTEHRSFRVSKYNMENSTKSLEDPKTILSSITQWLAHCWGTPWFCNTLFSMHRTHGHWLV